jgi:hypothetical protein
MACFAAYYSLRSERKTIISLISLIFLTEVF